MNVPASATSVILLVLSSALGACASQPSEDAADGDTAMSSASASCTPEGYSQASASYKKAVDGADARVKADGGDVCSQANMVTQASIASNAVSAVESCQAFKDVIRTSKDASNLRAVLANTVSYGIATGAIDTDTWAGLSEGLVGTKALGGVGGVDAWSIEFKEGGIGLLASHTFDAQTGRDEYPTQSIRWAVAKQGESTYVAVTGQPATGQPVTYRFFVQYAAAEGLAPILLARDGDRNLSTSLRHGVEEFTERRAPSRPPARAC